MEVSVTVTTHEPLSLAVTEPSQVGEVRRAAGALAGRLGFDETRRGEVAIVATELATNLVRHASGGEVIVQSFAEGDAFGLELMALDRGPGIGNVSEALRDGYSTGGSPGTGLGAMKRLASTFEIFSTLGSGTAVLVRFRSGDPLPGVPRPCCIGSICLPKRGEAACGDAWYATDLDATRTVILVADGLGHGLQAADASRQAVRLFRQDPHLPGPRQVEVLHAGLRATRGAAVAVIALDHAERKVRFTGVGNIAGAIVAGDASRSLLSHNGTVGAEVRRVQEMTYDWPAGSLLVLHSDGLSSQWQLGKYPGLRFRHPSLIAGVLFRDHRRERDDATVLVIGGGSDGRHPA
jgi:anti-sigma regulatory factor (Ser/Thr protein kinase)